ncbi:MAG: Na+/H+ antiporter NhaC family protein [Bacteroidetes bacterium SB0662_bin_6]|nr:Na+/H+ antiporter NhaC family protein [Bacteroidetes bacterium SB0668_bin_1]MYE04823.1 Na+/H+ antiporter NhaC family protein [Bacteroidetes bacterium SB0662_bin_6]
MLRGKAFDVRVEGVQTDADSAAVFTVRIGEAAPRALEASRDGQVYLRDAEVASTGSISVELLRNGQVVAQAGMHVIPGWVSIIPPLIAIAAALILRQVIPALFLGLVVGAWVAKGMGFTALWTGLLDTFQVYVLAALIDPGHGAIILFSLMIGGMVGIISRNGGMQDIVERIVRRTRSPRKAQLATWVLGLLVFFDDYANTLVVGNTMRSVTDRFKVSREKLAYIVDSTAAPVACLALVTTWIGYEVGLIGAAIENLDGFTESAYSVFLQSIPYSFYPILAILFVFCVASSDRDFGPMYRAEQRARLTGQVSSPNAEIVQDEGESAAIAPKAGVKYRAMDAVLPIVVLVVSVLGGLYVTGEGDTLRDIIGTADSYGALMWGSLLGVITAVALSLGRRTLSLSETVNAWFAGVKSMLLACVILVLAWALSEITTVIYTADYLISVLGDSLPPGIVPLLIFVLAALTAFSTGSSWGAMGILMPLVIPLVWAILEINGLTGGDHHHILYSSVACVLTGAVCGDHCSPISDTTILSSMASGCDHIDHVRTQLPYALFVGVVAMLLGILPAGFGMPWWIGMAIGGGVLFFGLRIFGRSIPEA